MKKEVKYDNGCKTNQNVNHDSFNLLHSDSDDDDDDLKWIYCTVLEVAPVY